MRHHSTSSADNVVYLRHTTSGAASGYVSSSALPTALATQVKNQTFLLGDPIPADESDRDGQPGNQEESVRHSFE